MRHAPSTLLAAALLAGCGQPLLSAQVEIPELRIATPPQDFPAASADPAYACSILAALPVNACAGVTSAYDLGAEVPVLEEKGVKAELRLTDVALRLAAGGISDLRGIARAEVAVRSPSGSFTKVAGYVRPAGAAPTTLVVSGRSNLDLAAYLRSGSIDTRIEVEMEPAFLPTGFTASVEAGFSLVVTLDYGAYF